MSRHDKTIEKICRQPTPSDVTWQELSSLLKSLDFELFKKSGGSRRKFIHRVSKQVISCHEPHPGPHAAKYLVEQVVESLKQTGHIK
jgi:hypothetical protein